MSQNKYGAFVYCKDILFLANVKVIFLSCFYFGSQKSKITMLDPILCQPIQFLCILELHLITSNWQFKIRKVLLQEWISNLNSTLASSKVQLSIFLQDRIFVGTQSRYREVPRWEIFMEQEFRFGLDLGWFGNFWGRFFHVFMGKILFKNIVDGENIFGIEWS